MLASPRSTGASDAEQPRAAPDSALLCRWTQTDPSRSGILRGMSSHSATPLPVGAAWDALAHLDPDALVAVCDPEICFESRVTEIENSVYRGHEGARRYIANLADAFERIEAEQFNLVVDRDQAVFDVRFRARGRRSGIEVEHNYHAAARGRDGKLLWWGFFDSRSDAAEAVGLTGEPPGAHARATQPLPANEPMARSGNRPVAGESAPSYALGHSDRELDRLQVQARLIEPITRGFFVDAGIVPGMRVLDVGSGVGDVAFLVADLVGDTGEVVGVDRSATALAVARERADGRSSRNVFFKQADPAEMAFERPFDAVVGRYILMFQPDPAAMLRGVAAHVRAGGVLVFHEPEWACARSDPPVASWDRCCEWVVAAMSAKGADMQMGMKLHATFAAAGLPAPSLRYVSVIGAGANCSDEVHFTADVAVTLLADIEELGLAAPGEIDPGTLADRIVADVAASGSVIVGRSEIGAWSRNE